MGGEIPRGAHEALTTAAETYPAALAVRLAGEAGLRSAEIPRVRPCDLRVAEAAPGTGVLSIPTAADESGVARETFVPQSLFTELGRYAESTDLDADEPFVDLSTRRVQMLVSEAAERAATLADDPALASITPQDLRQGFAKRLLERGIDPHVVREAGGWATMDALDAYLDPLDGEAIAAAVAPGVDANGPVTGTVEGSQHRTHRDDGWDRLLDAFAAIPAATDRDALFETVVERLTNGTRWRCAWIARGVTAGDGADTDIAAVARRDGDDPEATWNEPPPPIDDDTVPPWDRAIDEGEPVTRSLESAKTVSNAPASGSDGAKRGDDERESDVLLAVPIGHGDATYGALCLVADDEKVEDAELTAASVLGRCLGWGVTAGRWRDLLHSDAVTEVEFHTSAEDAFLAGASAALGCRIELASAVTVSEAASRCYLDIDGAGPQAVADAAATVEGVSETRVIETRANGCTVSVRVSGGSLVRALTEHGATVRDATAAEGRVRVVADLPDGTDVRPIADGLRATYPDVGLVSKESRTRSSLTDSTLREGVTDRLTDRQWATLSAAYHSGYFDWPRGSTAEEVADAMDVSSPTFHNHLRKAQRALLDTLFEDDPGPKRS